MRRKLFAGATGLAIVAILGCQDVIAPSGNPVDLSYAPCLGASDNPTWFAFQDGDGSWQQVTANSSGAFNFSIASGKGGIAMVTPDRGLFVVYATTEELQADFPACNGSVRTVAGSVTGYSSLDNVQLSMGTANDVVFGSSAPPAFFSLDGVDATTTDLVAIRYRTSSDGTTYEAYPNNIFLRRNVTGTTTSTVDFTSPTEAGAPLLRNVNVTNAVTGEALSVLSNVALGSTLANIAVYDGSATFVSGSVIAHFYGVPGARLTSGESQMVLVGAERQVSTATSERRFATFVFTDPTDQSVTLGPALGTVTVNGGSRPSASYNTQIAYDNLYDVVFSQGSGSTFRQVEVLATNAYLDGATAITLAVPNLIGTSGFQSSWLLSQGVSSSWSFLATDAGLAVLNSKAITYQGADRTSTFTP